jgi:hypothetical protein
MARTCPSCRTPVTDDGAAFCPSCGQRLALPVDLAKHEVPPSTLPAAGPVLGLGDLATEALVVGVVGGIVGSIPCLSILNCCCFLPAFGTIWVGLGTAIRRRPERFSFRAVLLAGMVAGIVAGAGAALGGYLGSVALTDEADVQQLQQLMKQVPNMPPALGELLQDWNKLSLVGLLVNIPLYAASCAVVGVLGAWAAARTMIADKVVDEG